MYFAGTGHDLSHDIDDDAMVWAYNNTAPPKAFFAGPGKTKVVTHMGVRTTDEETTKVHGGEGNIATGKGWNRNVWHALKLIRLYLEDTGENIIINMVGHSRGSITVIMLLNDLFFLDNPANVAKYTSGGYTISKTRPGKHSFKGTTGEGFVDWYKETIKSVWAKRLGNADLAEEGISWIDTIIANKSRIASVNAYLFDPVAGPTQGGSTRKQELPSHAKIKRVRVLRMEHGGAALNANMPEFKGWVFRSGSTASDLFVIAEGSKDVIPLPGSHGAGLSANVEKGQATTAYVRYVGTSYMLKFLETCGTTFIVGNTYFGDKGRMLFAYNQLYAEYIHKEIPDIDRRRIHSHHTFSEERHRALKIGSYVGHAINAHHKHLLDLKINPVEFTYRSLKPS